MRNPIERLRRAALAARQQVGYVAEHATEKTPDTDALDEVVAVLADYAKAVRVRRIVARQAQGVRVGRYAPYGWRIDPANPVRLLPVPEEQAAVERVRQLGRDGLTVFEICRRMDVEQPDLSRGRVWGFRTVRKMLARG